MFLVFLLHPHKSVDLLEVCLTLYNVKERFEDIEKLFTAFKKSDEDEIVLVETVGSVRGWSREGITLRVPIAIETLTKETSGVKVIGSLRDLQFYVDSKTCLENNDDEEAHYFSPPKTEPEPSPPEVVVRCEELAKKAGSLATLSLVISTILILATMTMNLVIVYNETDAKFQNFTRKFSFVTIMLFICTLVQAKAREMLMNVVRLCLVDVCLRTSIIVALVLAVTIFVGVVYV